MAGRVNYDGIEIMNLYLFGTSEVPQDFNERLSAAAEMLRTTICPSVESY